MLSSTVFFYVEGIRSRHRLNPDGRITAQGEIAHFDLPRDASSVVEPINIQLVRLGVRCGVLFHGFRLLC